MSNPVRTCAGCGQSDDHPRHVHALPDGTTFGLHMDCCAYSKNCEVCKAQLAGVGGVDKNPKGDKLREHLLTTGPGAKQPGWTAPSDKDVLAAAAARQEG